MNNESEFFICLWRSKTGVNAYLADEANEKIVQLAISVFSRDCPYKLRHESLCLALLIMGRLSHDQAVDLFVSVEPYKTLAE